MKIHGTAKGGALATKDFGVAFGAAAIPTSTFTIADSYRTTQRTIGHFGGGRKFAGLKYAFSDGTLIGAKVYLDNDVGAGTSGNVQLVIYTSTGTDARVLDSMAVSGLTTSMTEYTFTGSETVNTGDLIGLQMDVALSNAYRFNAGIYEAEEQWESVESWQLNDVGVASTLMSGSDYLYLCGIELTYTA